jgi:hypothetical protein
LTVFSVDVLIFELELAEYDFPACVILLVALVSIEVLSSLLVNSSDELTVMMMFPLEFVNASSPAFDLLSSSVFPTPLLASPHIKSAPTPFMRAFSHASSTAAGKISTPINRASTPDALITDIPTVPVPQYKSSSVSPS